MKTKPRWMKSVIEAAKADLPPLPMGRTPNSARYKNQPVRTPQVAKP
jgi:Tfp pilus assembly protein PilP